MYAAEVKSRQHFQDKIILASLRQKPVFGVSDKATLKSVYSATGTSYKIEISLVASLDMILPKKRTTKVLIRLPGCTGCSVPLLFANPQGQVFSRRGPFTVHVCCVYTKESSRGGRSFAYTQNLF